MEDDGLIEGDGLIERRQQGSVRESSSRGDGLIEGDRKGRPYIFPPPPGAINRAATTPYQHLRRKAGMSMPLPRLNYKA